MLPPRCGDKWDHYEKNYRDRSVFVKVKAIARSFLAVSVRLNHLASTLGKPSRQFSIFTYHTLLSFFFFWIGTIFCFNVAYTYGG